MINLPQNRRLQQAVFLLLVVAVVIVVVVVGVATDTVLYTGGVMISFFGFSLI